MVEGAGKSASGERSHEGEHPALFWLEKGMQIHAGRHPALFFSLYRLTRKDRSRVVTPETQLVIEGFPRSGNSFARVAFNQAQRGKVRIAHGLHVPAQVIRASRWGIPTLVLIRNPRDAVLSFVIRDPISIDQALKYYISFYETVENYSDAYVLGPFEEITEDFGEVINRINQRFGTTFSPFRHDEQNVNKVFARMEKNSRKRFGETRWETKVSVPSATKERIKHEVGLGLEDPRRKGLIAEAEAVYDRMTDPARRPR